MADSLQLPLNIVGKGDINRLERELAAVEEFISSSEVREAGTQPKMPRTSRLFDELVQQNNLNALLSEDRSKIRGFLTGLKNSAPVIHISFSADPSPLFTQKLVGWLRQNIHPSLLLSIGLQPSIGAGCIIRTTNKYFDMSLRQRFLDKREVLVSKLHVVAQTSKEAA